MPKDSSYAHKGLMNEWPQHTREIHASTFMVSLSLTGKQSGAGFVTGLPSFFAQLPSQKEMVGRSRPWICTMRSAETVNLLFNQVTKESCDDEGRVARTQDLSVRASGEGERCGPNDDTALGTSKRRLEIACHVQNPLRCRCRRLDRS
jgi:hypothetical protein